MGHKTVSPKLLFTSSPNTDALFKILSLLPFRMLRLHLKDWKWRHWPCHLMAFNGTESPPWKSLRGRNSEIFILLQSPWPR